MKKKIFAFVLTLTFLLGLSSCMGLSDMPFNGDIEFHDIALTIPERFIRDSTQSTDDLWFFEHGGYSELVIIKRSDIQEGENISAFLEDYVEYMGEQDADSNIVTFLEREAVFSAYTLDGVYCQEILFLCGMSCYAIALCGGTEEGFAELSDSVKLLNRLVDETT